MLFGDLKGKRVLVTGASAGLGTHFAELLALIDENMVPLAAGLGTHFAELLARYGAVATLAARRGQGLEEACERIRRRGGAAEMVQMDVADSTSVSEALAKAGGPFDILVNNAGIASAFPALDHEPGTWSGVVDTNLKGTFFVAQAVARGMRQAGQGGAIINIASILGHRVAGNVSAYAASKAGVIQLTKALALEWAREGIRVNALCPGYIETDLNSDFFASEAGQKLIQSIPQRRLGRLDDLDGPLLLLASDAGRYMTGSSVEVDGGHLVSSL